MSLVDRVPWSQQPQVDVGIDWTNPISQGLVFLENAAATNALSTGTPTLIPTKGGRAFSNLSAANYRSYQRAIPITSAKEVTMIVMASATANSASNAIFAVGSSTVANSFFAIASSTTNDVGLWVRDSAGTDQSIGGTQFDGKMRVYGGVHSNAENRMEAWTSTEGLTASTSPTTKTTFTALDRVAFGCLLRSTASVGGSNPTIAMGAIWNRALSATEMRSVLANPWQPFEPLPANNRKIWTGASLADTGGPKTIKVTRTKQPQTLVDIDVSNPLTKGLVRLVTFNRGKAFDLVSRTFLTEVNPNFTYGITTPKGVGISTNDQSASWSMSVRTETVQKFSFGWVGQINATTAAPLIVRDSTGVAGSGTIIFWNSGGWRQRIGATDYASAGTFNNNKIYSSVLTSSSSAAKTFVDGVLTINGGVPGSSALSSPWILHHNGTSTEGTLATSLLMAVWDRTLSDAEAISYSNNPWQLFAPINETLWLSEGVTAAITNPDASTLIPGLNLTSSTGILTAQTSAAFTLSGIAITSDFGIIGASATTTATGTVTGQSAVTGVGSVNGSSSVTYTISGLVSATQLGSLSVTASVGTTLEGLSSVSNIGTVTAIGTANASTTLIGLGTTSSNGVISANTSVSISLNGLQVGTSSGILSALGTTSAATSLVGVQITSQVGDITAEGSVPYTISLRYYTVASESHLYVSGERDSVFVPASRTVALSASMSRNNVFMSGERDTVLVVPSKDHLLSSSGSRDHNYVSNSRTSLFQTITRDN